MNKEIIIVSWGGIGDLLVCTPAIRAMKERHPDHRIIVYYPKGKSRHDLLLKHNPYVDSLRLLHWTSMWRYPKHYYYYLFSKDKIKYYWLNFEFVPIAYLYNKSVKEVVADIFNIGLSDNRVQMFFTEKEEARARRRLAPYKNVVLLHITSKSSVNHHWDLDSWKVLVQQMPGYTFIQVGRKNEPYVEGAIDWRGKTGLREVFCLLKFADSFAGVDSSLAHASNTFDVPGVVLFGDSNPVFWGHTNNINIYKKLTCSPCYYFLWGGTCYFGNRCMKDITVAEVHHALITQLNSKRNKTIMPAAH